MYTIPVQEMRGLILNCSQSEVSTGRLLQVNSPARFERVDGHLTDLTNTPPFGGYFILSLYPLVPPSDSQSQQ